MKGVTKAAKKANGLSHMCQSCPFLRICTPANARCCTDAFVEGFKKGAKAAEKAMKEKQSN